LHEHDRMRCLFRVRSHTIHLMFERSQSWGLRSNDAFAPSEELPALSSPLRKSAFSYICITSALLWLHFRNVQHRRLTASVSYGGQFFAYLFAPSASCSAVTFPFSKTQNPRFSLSGLMEWLYTQTGWLFVLFRRCTCQVGFAWGLFAFCMAF
jgi:hypothetical protein